MYQPRIALIVDHPQRDLAGLVLAAFELCQRGALCLLVPLNLQRKELWALGPDFVLLNYLRRSNEQLAAQLIQAGIRFGVLDTEGGVWANPNDYTELLAHASVREQASCVCTWGPCLAAHLVAHTFFAEAQIAVTGCPRFDCYHDQWRNVLAQENGGQHILINTNFPVINSRFASAKQNLHQLRSMYGWSSERTQRYADAERGAIEKTIALACDLGRDFPERSIVVRPHPFEDVGVYEQGIQGATNITINRTGPVQEQIFRSRVVIQRSCTTAIEANLAAVPTLSPQWIPAPSIMPMAEAVSVPCASYGELRATVNAIFEEHYQPTAELQTAVEQTTRNWFLSNDGNAHKRVAETVLGCVPTRRSVNERECARYLSGLDGARWPSAAWAGSQLRYRLGLAPEWSFRHMRRVPSYDWAATDKYFGQSDVAALVDRITAALHAQNQRPKPVSTAPAREQGEYLRGYNGHAIALFCD